MVDKDAVSEGNITAAVIVLFNGVEKPNQIFSPVSYVVGESVCLMYCVCA